MDDQVRILPFARRLLTLELDTLKGSYYANPIVDVPNVDPVVKAQHRPLYGNNVCMLCLFESYLTLTFHQRA